MNKLKKLAIVLLTFLLVGEMAGTISGADVAKPKTKELKVDSLFADTEGTMMIKSLRKNKMYVYNLKRSKERFTPESTFKVPNALIGLEEKVVKDEYDVKRWDGIVREIEEWNRDHTLGSGMRHSVIWYYQDMARDIGARKMQKHLNRINYGNRDISGGIDTFWLDSSLRISAQEQMAFMDRLVREKLPFHKQTMKTVKRMMIDDEQDSYTIHGKTGTRLSDMGLGWYVGFVETKKDIWVFATNVDSSGSVAKDITLKSLKKLRIIPKNKKRSM